MEHHKPAFYKPINLSEISTSFTGDIKNEDEAKAYLKEDRRSLRKLQEKLYAQGKHSLLIVFQAMDAAGKDSTIKAVMRGVNPQGCSVHSFKAPSSEERAHDFLWRCQKVLPRKGMIGIFNRSYYEEVLVTKVHPEFILGQNIPGLHKASDIKEEFWNNRYKGIRAFEKYLAESGTTILKFYLHVSKEEQAQRFLSRIENTDKHWKFNAKDMEERALWDDYRTAYEKCIEETHTPKAPWYVIPADNKWYMQHAVAEVISDSLKNLNLDYPKPKKEDLDKMDEAKKQLEKEMKKK